MEGHHLGSKGEWDHYFNGFIAGTFKFSTRMHISSPVLFVTQLHCLASVTCQLPATRTEFWPLPATLFPSPFSYLLLLHPFNSFLLLETHGSCCLFLKSFLASKQQVRCFPSLPYWMFLPGWSFIDEEGWVRVRIKWLSGGWETSLWDLKLGFLTLSPACFFHIKPFTSLLK